ncbi:hypothetical protein KIN20_001551 [Parelaphostrongylus tenuis]|uniref:Uncharacterized protein n=1 Tax=Parelaphostrongylus tenuis TaxID=148309 RepID=A0AAD5MFD9_PARTN|nr:hypothetical protein KIN20_001551 [Parelaphostrongylus tenuis]
MDLCGEWMPKKQIKCRNYYDSLSSKESEVSETLPYYNNFVFPLMKKKLKRPDMLSTLKSGYEVEHKVGAHSSDYSGLPKVGERAAEVYENSSAKAVCSDGGMCLRSRKVSEFRSHQCAKFSRTLWYRSSENACVSSYENPHLQNVRNDFSRAH